MLSPGFEDDAPESRWWRAFLTGNAPKVGQVATLTAVDLFCSVGGLSYGARVAANATGLGYKPLAGVDLDADALAVYRRNFSPSSLLHGNVAGTVDYHVYGRGADARLAYRPEIIDTRLGEFCGSTDLLLAGPPCQGHSNLNNHTRRNDPRNQMYVAAAAAAIAIDARIVIIENVPAVLNDRTEVVATAQQILQESGYFVSSAVLQASDFGAPQTRRRHFLVATKSPHLPIDRAVEEFVRTPGTLGQAIGDLTDLESTSFLDAVPTISAENQHRIDYLFNNKKYDLPNQLRPDCHKDGHTYPSVYGRLRMDLPAPTVTTGFMSPGRGRFIHPTRRRVLTAHEAARIQGFPDSFEFSNGEANPTKKMLSKWIGDAVPIQLGYIATLVALTGQGLRKGDAWRSSPVTA